MADSTPGGPGWEHGEFTLWRSDGVWRLHAPDGSAVPVEGLGMLGWVRRRDHAGAQRAAAEKITELTGQAVTGWEADESSRSVQGDSSWIAHLSPP